MGGTGVYFNRLKYLKDVLSYSYKIGRQPIVVNFEEEIGFISAQDFEKLPERSYNRQGIVLAFKYEQAIYVLPCSTKVDKLLEEEGFVKTSKLHVPFARDEERPLDTSSEWIELERLYREGVL